ncbi:MAG: histidine kinase [Bryobacteraceae bacterium]
MMAPAARRGASEAEGLRRIRLAGRRRLSRILHDEAGPSLCSAGLAAELLRGTISALSPEQEQLFARLQGALDSAMETVRLLSQEASPDLADRRGLAGALETLARAFHARLEIEAEPPRLAPVAAAALCECLRDALLAAAEAGGAAEVTLSVGELRVRAAGLDDIHVLTALEATLRAAEPDFAIHAGPEGAIIRFPAGRNR